MPLPISDQAGDIDVKPRYIVQVIRVEKPSSKDILNAEGACFAEIDIQAVRRGGGSVRVDVLVTATRVVIDFEPERKGELVVVGEVRDHHAIVELVKTQRVAEITCRRGGASNRSVAGAHRVVRVTAQSPEMCGSVVRFAEHVVEGIRSAVLRVGRVAERPVCIHRHRTVGRLRVVQHAQWIGFRVGIVRQCTGRDLVQRCVFVDAVGIVVRHRWVVHRRHRNLSRDVAGGFGAQVILGHHRKGVLRAGGVRGRGPVGMVCGIDRVVGAGCPGGGGGRAGTDLQRAAGDALDHESSHRAIHIRFVTLCRQFGEGDLHFGVFIGRINHRRKAGQGGQVVDCRHVDRFGFGVAGGAVAVRQNETDGSCHGGWIFRNVLVRDVPHQCLSGRGR